MICEFTKRFFSDFLLRFVLILFRFSILYYILSKVVYCLSPAQCQGIEKNVLWIVFFLYICIENLKLSIMEKIKKGTRKSPVKAGTTGTKAGRRRHVESAIPGAKVIELVPDAFGTGR